MGADFDVLIVGGGVGGAALALALAHAHPVRVLVIERRPGPGNINRGDSLLPAVTRHLKAWGALDRFMSAGANPVRKMQVFHHRAGLLLEAPLVGPDGSPYLVLPHPEIERTLADAARATGRVEFRFKTSLRTLLQDFVKAAIAPYKYPRAIEFRSELPRTGTGKLQRFRLRDPA